MTAVDCQISTKEDSIGIPNGFMDLRVKLAEDFNQSILYHENITIFQIVDEDAKELPIGSEGEVALKVKPVRPLGLFKGIYIYKTHVKNCISKHLQFYRLSS